MEYLINFYENIKKNSTNSYPLDFDSCKFICELINKHNFENLLEIGTGFGFSSLYFALNSKIKKITTIEKNVDVFNFAKKQNKTNKIIYLNEDAFVYNTKEKFDCIFIDGPKSNQVNLFENVEKFLNIKGMIIIDNIFLNRVRNKVKTKSTIRLLERNEQFKNYLKNLNNYYVEFINIGDGIAILKRR